MAEKRIYYRGQGKIFAHAREFDADTGVSKPGLGIWLGNAPAFSVTLSVEKQEHRESYSGQNLIDVSYITAKNASIACTLEEFSAFNLGLCLNGESTKVAADSTERSLELPALAPGDVVSLGEVNIDDFTFETSGGTPIAEASYSIDKGTGTLEALAAIAAGAVVEFSTLAYDATSMFTQPDLEWWVRFAGLNMLDELRPTVVDLYRVKFEPVQNLGLISAELAQLEIAGTPLADQTRPSGDPFGQFGKIQMVRG
jgi:hypothetical protein